MLAMTVIEFVTFRIKAGTDDGALLAAITESTGFLERQPGFLQREVAVSASGEWADIIHWTDMDAALRAAGAFQTAPEVQAFSPLLEPDSVRVRHFRSISEQGWRRTRRRIRRDLLDGRDSHGLSSAACGRPSPDGRRRDRSSLPDAGRQPLLPDRDSPAP